MPFSTRAMRPADWASLKHFKAHEFKFPERMGFEFMRWLDGVRAELGMSLTVSSDWRDKGHNATVGGAKLSAHMDTICDAVDFSSANMTGHKRLMLVAIAYARGCRRIGIYANGSVHIDRTEDRRPEAMWVKV
jgi:hypothetical protein